MGEVAAAESERCFMEAGSPFPPTPQSAGVLKLQPPKLLRLAPDSALAACHVYFSWWPGERRRAVASGRSSEVGPDSGAAS
ncbi:hypothetical protein GCM10009863_41870 [Streptomyces axinellae]|uniref:Uncharacterized protein n=1 Tax=Streptomyces axinellae TaxID=552788 RepID=A0ABP6CLB4_9ACTN